MSTAAPPRKPPEKGTGIPDRPDGDGYYGARCSICAIDWPLVPKLFGLHRAITTRDKHTLPCPQCEEACDIASDIDPIEVGEAFRLKAHADFERYFEERGERDVLSEADLAQYGVD